MLFKTDWINNKWLQNWLNVNSNCILCLSYTCDRNLPRKFPYIKMHLETRLTACVCVCVDFMLSSFAFAPCIINVKINVCVFLHIIYFLWINRINTIGAAITSHRAELIKWICSWSWYWVWKYKWAPVFYEFGNFAWL